jgi:hypothetical protein
MVRSLGVKMASAANVRKAIYDGQCEPEQLPDLVRDLAEVLMALEMKVDQLQQDLESVRSSCRG